MEDKTSKETFFLNHFRLQSNLGQKIYHQKLEMSQTELIVTSCSYLESIDSSVVDTFFEVTGVDDVNDTVDCQRSFSDVGRNDDFSHALVARTKDLALSFERKCGVNRQCHLHKEYFFRQRRTNQ